MIVKRAAGAHCASATRGFDMDVNVLVLDTPTRYQRNFARTDHSGSIDFLR